MIVFWTILGLVSVAWVVTRDWRRRSCGGIVHMGERTLYSKIPCRLCKTNVCLHCRIEGPEQGFKSHHCIHE